MRAPAKKSGALSSWFFPLLLLPGLAVCGALVRYQEAHTERSRSQFSADEMQVAKESIALSLMGQVQLTAHSLIWMKTLEYLHNGVALRMPTEAEERCGFHAHQATDVSSGLAHKCGVPVALNDDMDWRGPVGRLQREIVPHMAIHSHSSPVELIPWYQLTLKLNPNIERLYVLAAFFIADFAGEPKKALELLEGGVEANPWTFEVRAALGRLLFDYHEQLRIPPTEAYGRAASVLDEAVSFAKQEKARAESGEDPFDDYQNQLFRESYLFLAKSLTELGRYDEALAACDEGFRATGHNLLRVQRRLSLKRMESAPRPR